MANAIEQLTDRVLVLGRLTIVRRAITAVAVTNPPFSRRF